MNLPVPCVKSRRLYSPASKNVALSALDVDPVGWTHGDCGHKLLEGTHVSVHFSLTFTRVSGDLRLHIPNKKVLKLAL